MFDQQCLIEGSSGVFHSSRRRARFLFKQKDVQRISMKTKEIPAKGVLMYCPSHWYIRKLRSLHRKVFLGQFLISHTTIAQASFHRAQLSCGKSKTLCFPIAILWTTKRGDKYAVSCLIFTANTLYNAFSVISALHCRK